jgi:hypothetical protein
MMNLLPHHRIHVPNGLAMFAALLLLISSVVGFETHQGVYSSGQEATPAIKVDTNANDNIDDSGVHKRRVLNLGLLLFRRG